HRRQPVPNGVELLTLEKPLPHVPLNQHRDVRLHCDELPRPAPLCSVRPAQGLLGATANFEIMTREGGGATWVVPKSARVGAVLWEELRRAAPYAGAKWRSSRGARQRA